jgi:hypothetical protein
MDPKDTIHLKEIIADGRGASLKGMSGDLVKEANQVSLSDRGDFGITANAIPTLPQWLDEKIREESPQSNDKVEPRGTNTRKYFELRSLR